MKAKLLSIDKTKLILWVAFLILDALVVVGSELGILSFADIVVGVIMLGIVGFFIAVTPK